MKQALTFVAATLMAGFAAHASYVTSCDGSVVTFASLSQIDGSGVTKADNGYHVAGDLVISATDTLRICDNDYVRLSDNVTITIEGYADFNAPTKATFSAIEKDDKPIGILLRGAEACLGGIRMAQPRGAAPAHTRGTRGTRAFIDSPAAERAPQREVSLWGARPAPHRRRATASLISKSQPNQPLIPYLSRFASKNLQKSNPPIPFRKKTIHACIAATVSYVVTIRSAPRLMATAVRNE